jgi:hypothetical protein
MRRVATAVVCAAAASFAYAYNDGPESERAFPRWLVPHPTRPVDPGAYPTAISYEVKIAGPHLAEVHLCNLSPTTWHFDFWFPGWQRPGDNDRVHLPPLGPEHETKILTRLRSGRPGLSTSYMCVYDLRRGDDAGAALSPLADVADPPLPDETWMPARPLVDDGTVRRSELQARVFEKDGRAVVAFRNPSARDLFFRFEVPALGVAAAAHPRVSLRGGGETSVDVPLVPTVTPLPLLRVVVCDLRVGDDAGTLFSEDRRADLGWLPLATDDDSTALPPGKLLATLSRVDDRRARVRFRSRLRTPVRFRFAVPDYQESVRASDAVTVAPNAETAIEVALDRPADARLAVARLRVFEVSHRDDQ